MKPPKLNAYDRVAPFYDGLARIVFGKSIVKAQLVHLPMIPPKSKVLILGGGTGWLLEALLREKPESTYHYAETSAKMISLATQRIGYLQNVHFLHGSFSAEKTGCKWDVIIANFFLDQFDEAEIALMLTELELRMNPGAMLMVTDFQKTKAWHKLYLWMMYSFFRAVGAVSVKILPEWGKLILHRHYQVQKSVTFYGDFIRSAVIRN
jgi:tRNA (cmo5U34)-methyltransferase